jgi:hypothetical protein
MADRRSVSGERPELLPFATGRPNLDRPPPPSRSRRRPLRVAGTGGGLGAVAQGDLR